MLMLDFSGFLVMLMMSFFVAGVLHYGFNYYVMPGPWSFMSKVIIAFIGGAFGPMFFGHWMASFAGVPLMPALIGSFALVILAVDVTHSVRGKAT
ncbi:MAG: hypothetical protein EPO08_07010 [Rhodospirillaceae bacterium]|nr:MAG: hypothetical protein EPO08_07010 [Rhodospirillaceae bacterium]